MNTKAITGIVLGVMFLSLFIVAILPGGTSWPASSPGHDDVGSEKWGPRAYEVLLQGFILLAGVVAIILLLRSRKYEEVPP